MHAMTHENPWAGSHPFLDFRFRLDLPPLSFWARLGECSAAIEQIIGAPLRPDVAERMSDARRAGAIHGTVSIEGNILSVEQVGGRIAGNLALPPAREYLGREVDAILRGCEYLSSRSIENIADDFSPTAARDLNRIILDGPEISGDILPGEFRSGIGRVADYRSPEPEHTARLLDLAADWLNHPDWRKQYGGVFVMPILRAVLAHLYLAWIRPFGDGNGRTARLVEFDLLVRTGVPPVAAHLLSDYYGRTRTYYYLALSDARQSPAAFVEYAIGGLREMLRELVDQIRACQREVAWTDFVLTAFRPGSATRAVERQRKLLLALGSRGEPVSIAAIRTIDPELSAMYGRVQSRMVSLDLAALTTAGLIRIEGGMVRARFELVRPFLRTG